MGSLIPTTSDSEICDNLTKRFSNQKKPNTNKTWLQHLQDHNSREPLFAPNRKLARVAYRLAVSVAGAEVPSIKKHRQRWFHLLHKLLPPETDAAIRSVLSAVLDPANNIPYAIFTTEPAPIGLDFELYPQNSGIPYLQLDGSCLVNLQCKTDTELPDPTTPESDPPPSDPNEQTIATTGKRGTKRGKKKGPKKSVAKKSLAKKSSVKRPSKKKKKFTKVSAKKAKKSKKAKKGKFRD
jgi:hypothetical protein